MSDAEIIEWVQQHLQALRVIGHMARDTYEMEYVDADGHTHCIEGLDLRDCVLAARDKLETV